MANVLIVDDSREMSEMLFETISGMEHTANVAYTLKEGLAKATAGRYDVILLDIRLPDGDGVEKLPSFKTLPYQPEVIIITGHGSRGSAELALSSGAWDYISKTTSISEIRLTVASAIKYKQQQIRQPVIPLDLKLGGLIWKSDRMATCITHLVQAAKSDANVLITGETGTGKELFAQAIHNNSDREEMSFVTVDCAALPPTLAESILFGHEKGAFTGADKAMEGLIKQADGGTLFLDEICELPLSIQKSFLRVLQEKRFRALGAKHEIKSNFRIVAATNRNTEEMISAGKFRNDLLHRIKSINIHLPPLRKRPEDVLDLILYYSKKVCERYGMGIKSFSPEFLETIVAYDWPGNVRELINCMEWTIATAGAEPSLYPKHLPVNIRMNSLYKDSPAEIAADNVPLPTMKEARESATSEAELQYLRRLLTTVKGDLNEACRLSGLSRPQLYNQMRKHNLTRSSFSTD
jgi:two-component system, NtrC family, response regulator